MYCCTGERGGDIYRIETEQQNRAHPSQGSLVAAQAAGREAFRAKTLAAIPEVYPQAVAAGHQQDVGAASLHFSSGASNSIGVCARPSKKRYLGCKISRGWLVKKIQDPRI